MRLKRSQAESFVLAVEIRSTLSAFPLIEGVPNGNACDKHGLDRSGVAWISEFRQPIKTIMQCISEIRKMNNHLKLKFYYEKVLAKQSSGLYLEVAQALGDRRLGLLTARFPRGLNRQDQAVESRWLMVQTTVTQMDFKRQMTVCLLIVGFSEGSSGNRRKQAQSLAGRMWHQRLR